MNEFGVFLELCDVSVVNVFGVFEDRCVVPVRVYGQHVSGARREKQDACGAAEGVDDDFFAEVDGADLAINLEVF